MSMCRMHDEEKTFSGGFLVGSKVGERMVLSGVQEKKREASSSSSRNSDSKVLDLGEWGAGRMETCSCVEGRDEGVRTGVLRLLSRRHRFWRRFVGGWFCIVRIAVVAL